MDIPFFQVDAFARRPFEGNPAAVCMLDHWPDDSTLANIAAENNLSETAFLVGGKGRYHLRWLTPTVEVDLCGHATLAAAWVVFQHLEPACRQVRFTTRSGELAVTRDDDRLSMDFPSRPPRPCDVPAALLDALNHAPREVLRSRDYLVVYETAERIRGLEADMPLLSQLDCLGVIVTAPGDDCDFVSRFFAPGAGVPEDPVTGSAHSTLVPYWAERLGKQHLFAKQLSRRGGELWCEHAGDRVRIAGYAVEFLSGTIRI